MSLYRYVNGREDLLEGIVDHIVKQLHLRPDHQQLEPAGGWQAYLQWLAHGVRGLAHDHPNVFPLIATRHPAAPWLRPPLRSLRVVEDFLTTLISHGFSDTRAVMAYRAFSSFLLGHLLLEASLLGAQTAPATEPLDEGESDVPNADQALDLHKFPHIQRLESQLSEDHAAPEFEQALEDLLDRLDRHITE
jgi:AcrR family transcriptional regulator